MFGLRIPNTLLYGGNAVLKILLRAGLALLLAAVFSDDVAAWIQPFYSVDELSVFVISYAFLLLLFIKPSHMRDAVERRNEDDDERSVMIIEATDQGKTLDSGLRKISLLHPLG